MVRSKGINILIAMRIKGKEQIIAKTRPWEEKRSNALYYILFMPIKTTYSKFH